MKRIYTLALAFAFTFLMTHVSAQCVINTADSIEGFTPTSIPCLEQDSVIGVPVQVHVPATINTGVTVTIDSIHLTSIDGLPAGISYSTTPASAVISGGGNGCIYYSGSTTAAIGNYPLTFRTRVWIRGGIVIDTVLNSFGINFSLNVCGAPVVSCDTIMNFSTHDTGTVYYSPGYGYISGTNDYGIPEVAERFTAPKKAHVTGATLAFGAANIDTNNADSISLVTVYVYDADTITHLPGAIIDSGTIPLLTIAQSVVFHSAVLVSFPNQPTLSGTDFYISVLLPSNPIDSIALLSNTVHSLDGRGWINATDLFGSWIPLDSLVGLTPPNHMGFYIFANTCGGAPVPAFTSTTHTGCGSVTVNFTDESKNSPYQWHWLFSAGHPSSSFAQNPVVTYTAAGTHTVRLITTNADGTDTVISTGYVVVYPNITKDSLVTVSASSASAVDGAATVDAVTGGTPPYTYLWSNQVTTPADSNVATGVYYVTITDAHSCQRVDTAFVSFTAPNGIAGIEVRKMLIYPNPTTDILNIQWSTGTEVEISVHDLTGKQLRNYTTSAALSTIDIHELASGMYLLMITDKVTKQQQSIKFNKL